MTNLDHDFADEARPKPKAHPASSRQLNYLFDSAAHEGMDAEYLSRINYGKDLMDLTEDEASALMECVHA